MKLIITILALLSLTSCTPAQIPHEDEPLKQPPTEQPDEPYKPTNKTMKITIGNSTFTATLANNATGTAFKAMLPITLTMNDYNSNEKVCSLPNNLTTSPTNVGTIHAGDIMLYGASSIVVFYDTFSTSYSYTRIGKIDNITGLKTALGTGDVILKFE